MAIAAYLPRTGQDLLGLLIVIAAGALPPVLAATHRPTAPPRIQVV